MKITPLRLADVLLIEHDVFKDARGSFRETWNIERYKEAGFPDVTFVQENHSNSSKGVVRGLHFQRSRPQGKLVHVTRGRILDVAVDVRDSSPDFGQWVASELSAEDGNQLWVPPGFAHGFWTLTDDVDLVYLCSTTFDAATDGGIRWDDPEIGIEWPVSEPILSKKDSALPSLAEAHSNGLLPELVS